MESHKISDYQITASGYHTSISRQTPPYMARLNTNTPLGLEYPYWQDPSPPHSWFQVDLFVAHVIATLEIQGDPDSSDVVQTFKLQYSPDVITWTPYVTSSGSSVSLQ